MKILKLLFSIPSILALHLQVGGPLHGKPQEPYLKLQRKLACCKLGAVEPKLLISRCCVEKDKLRLHLHMPAVRDPD